MARRPARSRTDLDTAFAVTARAFGPGVFGLVMERGRIVFEGSRGTADVDSPRPIRPHDWFRVGSITKTYVSVLVMQLAERGALRLTDEVQRWLPGLLSCGAEITVEQLLGMRSGLLDYVPVLLGPNLQNDFVRAAFRPL